MFGFVSLQLSDNSGDLGFTIAFITAGLNRVVPGSEATQQPIGFLLTLSIVKHSLTLLDGLLGLSFHLVKKSHVPAPSSLAPHQRALAKYGCSFEFTRQPYPTC